MPRIEHLMLALALALVPSRRQAIIWLKHLYPTTVVRKEFKSFLPFLALALALALALNRPSTGIEQVYLARHLDS